MKTLNTLRYLIILTVFAVAAATASASDGPKKAGSAQKPVATTQDRPARKQVAAFVDPTAPLAEFVERNRAELASQRP